CSTASGRKLEARHIPRSCLKGVRIPFAELSTPNHSFVQFEMASAVYHCQDFTEKEGRISTALETRPSTLRLVNAHGPGEIPSFPRVGFSPFRSYTEISNMSDVHSPPMETASPHVALVQMAMGHWISRIVHVAAQLELADRLAGGSKTAEELAGPTGTDAPSL